MLRCLIFLFVFLITSLPSCFAITQAEYQNMIKQQQLKQQAKNYLPTAINAFKSGNYVLAEQYLTELARYLSDDYEVYSYLGESQRQQKKYDLAASNFMRAYSLNKSDMQSVMGLGYIYGDNHDFQKAAGFMTVASQIEPDNPKPPYFLGLACVQLNNAQCTIKAMGRVVSIAPSYGPDPYLIMGETYSYMKNYQPSLQSYLKGIQYFPQEPVLYYRAGDLYLAMENIDLSIKYLVKAVDLYPAYEDAHAVLGNAYLAIHDLDNADKECSILTDLKSSQAKPLCQKVQQLIMQRMMQQQMQQQQMEQEQRDMEQQQRDLDQIQSGIQ